MTRARRQQIALEETSYYHCVSRCVRRAFLCGYDRYAGKDYEHRREWVRARLAQLVEVFSIDLCAYAIMFNHYHVVLRVDQAQARSWSSREVLQRWTQLFSGPEVIHRYLDGDPVDSEQRHQIERLADTWRERLADISWFMRSLNEPIAREANREDGCKGRFWEGRFKSQALLDEKAVLACMAYVDLNPVRAGMADTPEASAYTSIQQRSGALRTHQCRESDHEVIVPTLAPMAEDDNTSCETVCEMPLLDYLQLVDDTGRCLRSDKRGAIPLEARPILDRLGIDAESWVRHMRPRLSYQLQAMGAAKAVKSYARAIGRRWLWGAGACGGLCEPV